MAGKDWVDEVKVLDVSYFQGKSIDWKKVKASGVSGAVLRIGYGRETNQKDSTFDGNVKGCRAAGMPFLPYHYSYATDTAGAKKEAQCFLKWAEGKSFDRKLVFYDVEEKSQYNLSQTKIRALIDAYADELQKEGWEVGVYSYLYFLQKIGEDWLDKNYKVWVAQYNDTCDYDGKKVLWQYTSKGKISGVSGNVDVNECYDASIFKVNDQEENVSEMSATGTVTGTTTLNVRSGSANTTDKIGVLDRGDSVKITGKTSNNWYRISFSGKTGYVNSVYIKLNTDQEEQEEETVATLKNPNPKASKVKTVSYKKYGDVQLTDHFKLHEFRCNDGSDTIKFDWYVVNALEAARRFFDKPLVISSAYRTTAYNTKIGGAYGSLHTKGKAVDCYISGQSPSLLAKFFEARGMKGVGCYYDDLFVHVDSRTSEFLWKNQSETKVSTHLPTIRTGSSGQDVKDAQRLLNLSGAKLTEDGIFGTNTNKEVKNFQASKGLVVDGIIGPNTWKALLK